MEIGVCTWVRVLPTRPQPLPDAYREFFEQGMLAEELGFDEVWLSEHHFAEDAWNPSQFPLLAALAARTRRIRVGTYVLLLPLHNPIRVAEDAATVDLISNGRLDLACGGTAMEVECETFGVNPTESFGRSYEALTIIEKCFTEDEFSYQGKYFNFANVRMTTKPVQKPRIPIYIGALGPQSLERAAKRGYHLASAFHSPIWPKYGEMQRQLGRKRDSYRIVSGPLFVHVAENKSQAWDEAEEGMHWAMSFYGRQRPGRHYPIHSVAKPLPPVGRLRHESENATYGLTPAVGSVDDVLRILSAYRDEDVDELVPTFHFPGMNFEHVKRSMRLFAKEIMPEIRKWGRKPGKH
jgi:alkanesulfonate monooxygenase SsuD/methylene tetrahydromethanopterin reductase-like flavin-dependent oxidoreductase (luciferase family)